MPMPDSRALALTIASALRAAGCAQPGIDPCRASISGSIEKARQCEGGEYAKDHDDHDQLDQGEAVLPAQRGLPPDQFSARPRCFCRGEFIRLAVCDQPMRKVRQASWCQTTRIEALMFVVAPQVSGSSVPGE